MLRDLSLMWGGEYQSGEENEKVSRLAFGTVVRAAPIEKGGELIVLDWEAKEIEAKTPIRPRNPTIEKDPNPRGNGRGCRGISRWNGDLVVASYHTLEIYDQQLVQVDAVNDGLMVGLHEIKVTDRNTVLVTSTTIDAVIEYDLLNGTRNRSFWPRENSALQDTLDLEPLQIDEEADNRLRYLDPAVTDDENHLHMNAVAEHDKIVYALCNAYGVVLDLTHGEIALRCEGLQDAHNLIVTDEGIAIINDTWGTAVRFYDLQERRLLKSIDLTRYRWVRELIRWKIPAYWGKKLLARKTGFTEATAKPLFVRGLVHQQDELFVGVSPAAILRLNWRTEELLDAFKYSSDVRVCIHGLEVIG